VPLHGTSFVFKQLGRLFSGEHEIIDYDTFKTVDTVNGGVHDIWRDKLLIAGFSGDKIDHLLEKKTGGSSDDGFYLKINGFTEAKFLYDGTAIVVGYTGRRSDAQFYWFTIENGKTSNPVIYEKGKNVGGAVPARQAPVVAIVASKSRAFDRNSIGWIEVYDINTQQKLLQTKTYKDGFRYTISDDGRSLAVLRTEKRKIELYTVPEPGAKKK
jgi:hypothetical protein